MDDKWFTKKEIIKRLISDGCNKQPYYISIRLSQLNGFLQYNKHYKFDKKGRVLYSEKTYGDYIKPKFI